jgi:hypothetical protein
MVDNGDGPRPSSAEEVIQGWQVTLSPLDAVYHQVNGRGATKTLHGVLPVVVHGPLSAYTRLVHGSLADRHYFS